MSMTTDARDAHMLAMEKMILMMSEQIAALSPQWPDHTVGELLEHVLKTQWLHAKGRRWLRWALDKHLIPGLGALQLKNFTPAVAQTFFLGFHDRKTLHNRLRATMRTAWKNATELDWVPAASHDPFVRVKKFCETSRKRVFSEAEQAAFESARARVEAAASKLATRSACQAFRLALLCAFRPTEAYTLRRDAVDFIKRTVTLPDHKTADKIGERVVSLTEQAADFLRRIPAVPGNPYFFPGRTAGQPISNPIRAFKLICRTAGFSNAQVRDLRRTWGSTALERGVNIKVIANQLGHTTTDTTEKHYAFMGQKKQAAAIDDRMGNL